jgi:peptidoglycan/LPS O-acetylase OafA/YrhL
MARNRFEFLDGIRGIAAILVVTRHTEDFWNFHLFRSYLAVDLFFILSGFVIAHAYDEKLGSRNLSLLHFMRIRLIRLYPVFLLSLAVSAMLLIYKSQISGSANITGILGVIALNAFFVPSHLGGSTLLFPINGPYWSLCYELFANVIYAAIRPVLNNPAETTIVIGCGLLLGVFAYTNGGLNLGFQFGYTSLIAGAARSIFGIFMGIALFRRQAGFVVRFGKLVSPWAAVAGICIILLCPDLRRFNSIADFISVTILFPLLILFASQAEPGRFKASLLALGSMSYPIYVFHEPFGGLLLIGFREAVVRFAPFSGFALVFFLGIVALLIEKCYDIPLRRWLLRRSRAADALPLKS